MIFDHNGYEPTIFKGHNYANIPYRASANRITMKNWKIYFTPNDVNAFLFAAASAGQTAMMAALDSLSVMIGGLIGGGIAIILDIAGIASMANLCYLVIQSKYLNKGVYIGIEWNGGFPNYTQGLW